MRPGIKRLRDVAFALACIGASCGLARAEDTKGKWQFGFGISYYATTDYIRSNSDVALAGTVAGQGGSALPAVGAVDDRPDENMLNEPSVKDDFRFDFSASYGLTRWFALEVATSYMQSEVGQIEFYTEDRRTTLLPGSPISVAGNFAQFCGPTRTGTCYNYGDSTFATERDNGFLQVGEITEVPLMLSGLFRFRPESPLDPYIGVGIGYIFTDITVSDEFNEKSEEIQTRLVSNASYGEVTDQANPNRISPYFPGPMTVDLSDGFEYHVVGGVDYYVNDRFSMYVDARYVWAESEVDVRIDGAHQVRMPAFDPGRLQRLDQGSVNAPNFWEDGGLTGCASCTHDGLLATEDGNGNRTLDPMLGEGAGVIYLFPAGPNPPHPTDPVGGWTSNNAVGVIDCSATPATCPWMNDGIFQTEDLNQNGYLDRYLSYGLDFCTVPANRSLPACVGSGAGSEIAYVWPDGCGTSPSNATGSSRLAEGCPPIPAAGSATYTSTGGDNATDIYLIQGGKINLGGFSIGMGVKFTF